MRVARAVVVMSLIGAGLAAPAGADPGGPTAIGQDSKGVSYVGFAAEGNIGRIDASGAVLSSFSSGLTQPVNGIAVDASDTVWVAFPSAVRQYTSAGAQLSAFSHTNPSECNSSARNPARYGGIAVNATTVYVASNCSPQLQVYSRSGTTLATVSLPGVPRGVAYGPGQNGRPAAVYVALPDQDKVLTFNAETLSSSSSPTNTLTVAATGGGGTAAPAGVAVDIYGQLMVTDIANNSIQFYDTNNAYSMYRVLGHPPNPGSGVGSLSSPGALAIHGQDGSSLSGNLFIADHGNSRVQRWDSGGGTYWAAPTGAGAPPQSAPVNTAVPTISGTPAVGQTLTCSNGEWSGNPTSYNRGWNRDGSYLPGFNGTTYVVQAADAGHQITCFTQAVNAVGPGGYATSAPVTIGSGGPSAPANSVAPSITGTAATGQTLTCQPGTWSGSPSFAYRFERSGSTVGNAQTYTVTAADVGSAITCVVTATNAGGSASATSAPVTPTAPATCTGPVGVSINSAAAYTNNQAVTLTIRPPAGATSVTISNDGGFDTATTSALAGSCSYAWTLLSTGSERLPKTVYVRFSGSTQTFTDDIVLDTRPPTLTLATVSGGATARSAVAASAARTLTVRAKDTGSGLGKVQYASQRGGRGTTVRYRARLRVRSAAAARWVRVFDRAGNPGPWKRVRTHR